MQPSVTWNVRKQYSIPDSTGSTPLQNLQASQMAPDLSLSSFSYQKQSQSFISSGLTRLLQWLEDFPVTEQVKLVGFILLISTDLAWLFELCKNTHTALVCSSSQYYRSTAASQALANSTSASYFQLPLCYKTKYLTHLCLWKQPKSKCII